ncbi:GNAT family N-acetyltransferase [Clostridium thermarum]|uniref:GNAT family N-acetyltransferase n=1 Tax=Clostridium thermarum TaxID=1716543 RepID=UPI0011225C3D|nr:GNAT family N-acetyltransferase [Clostridium thermarum]
MVIETDRLILREMTEDDFGSLYAVLADSDIIGYYPYSFDEARVRGWIRKNRESIAYGCQLIDEFEDEENEITKLYTINRTQWEKYIKIATDYINI